MSEEVLLFGGFFFGVLGIAALVAWILFLLTLYKTAEEITLDDRQLNPGYVWLNLIPLFNVVWIFFTIIWLSRDMTDQAQHYLDKKPAKTPKGDLTEIQEQEADKIWGLVFAGLWASTLIPYLNTITMIAAVIVWIIYWVKITNNRKVLEESRKELANA